MALLNSNLRPRTRFPLMMLPLGSNIRQQNAGSDLSGSLSGGYGGCDNGISLGLLITTLVSIAVMFYALYTKITMAGKKRKRSIQSSHLAYTTDLILSGTTLHTFKLLHCTHDALYQHSFYAHRPCQDLFRPEAPPKPTACLVGCLEPVATNELIIMVMKSTIVTRGSALLFFSRLCSALLR